MSFTYKNFKLNGKDDCYDRIEESKDQYLEVTSYCFCNWKQILYGFSAFFTLGFMCLLARWKPVWYVRATSSKCSLVEADVLVLKDYHGVYSVSSVEEQVIHSQDQPRYQSNDHRRIRYFTHKCVRYIWNDERHSFQQLRGYDQGLLCADFTAKFHGLSKIQQEEKLQIYGLNKTHIEVKSYFNLLINEVLNPFYIFQIVSIILWMSDNYYYYAGVIFVISVLSICITLYETKKQQIALHEMAESASSQYVNVCRGGEVFEDIIATELVPGDVISIPSHGCYMTCDAVLTSGSCIVNESMLTGESVPETKTPLSRNDDDELYDIHLHKRHTLFSGTEVIQTRYYGSDKVLAVIIRTGFSTSKGELLRSIMFPRPLGFRFYKEAMRFVLVLFCLSALGMAYSIYLYVERGMPVLVTIVRALDIITVVVPPALPAALTIGTVYAQNHLKKKGIFCISPPHINVAGKLKLLCFDKTGTLTAEGLDLWGIVPVENGEFCSMMHDPARLSRESRQIAAMATCHSLTRIDENLTGDPLDLKMFQAINWNLEEPGTDNNKYDLLSPTIVYPNEMKNSETMPYEIGILRQFPFSSSLQCMSVVCRTLGASHMDIYAKGAPEKIVSLCLPNTVPRNFEIFLQNYALKGFRVIALAWKPLEQKLTWHHLQRSKRAELEKDLIFLGLLIMQNMLKPETTPIIHVLKKACIRSVMVTGDNLLTALSVARECSMVPYTDKIILIKAVPPDKDNQTPAEIRWEYSEAGTPKGSDCDLSSSFTDDNIELYQTICLEENSNYHFAIDGKSFAVVRTYFPDIFIKLMVRGTVFARMLPDQKTQLVEGLQEIGYSVGMCGDGANDCGALKTADVGISLSEAEASIAAPFTSKVANIECVPSVIKEGRCALVTAVSVFKFITLYSIIQFISVLVLYTVKTNLADKMFLYIDLGITTTLAIVMSNTKAYDELVRERPRGSLLNPTATLSIFLHIILMIFGQAVTLIFLQHQRWYKPLHPNKTEDAIASWESSAIFLFSCYQYIFAGVVLSKGPPFRKPFFTNVYFVISLVLLILFTTLLLFNPFPELADFFQIIRWQPNRHFRFRLTLLLMACCSLFMSIMIELFVSEGKWVKSITNLCVKRKPKTYKKIEKDLASNPSWPNVKEPVYAIGTIHIVS